MGKITLEVDIRSMSHEAVYLHGIISHTGRQVIVRNEA